jgi:hypothetical protein
VGQQWPTLLKGATMIVLFNRDTGKPQKFDEFGFEYYLENGWCLDPNDIGKEEVKEAPTKEEADINESGKLNPTEIRQAAKEAGIKNYKKARISTLKKKLGYDNQG